MDDLTVIRGIGPAAAKKLVAAGIDSFAKLAVATPEQLVAIERLPGSPADWSAWLGEAKAKLPAGPTNINAASASEIADRARLIETTRQKLAELADAAVDAHAAIVGLPADANQDALEDVMVAERLLRSQIDVVAADARKLLGVPDGEDLPPALAEELAVLFALDLDDAEKASEVAPAEVAAQQDSDAHQPDDTPSDDDVLDGEAGNLAGLTQADIDRMVAMEAVRVGESVRAVAKLDPAAALANLAEERRRAQLMISMAGLISAELAAIELELTRTETVWPLTVIRFDGAERPIGEPLLVDPATFLALTKSGAASDQPPETEEN